MFPHETSIHPDFPKRNSGSQALVSLERNLEAGKPNAELTAGQLGHLGRLLREELMVNNPLEKGLICHSGTLHGGRLPGHYTRY